MSDWSEVIFFEVDQEKKMENVEKASLWQMLNSEINVGT